MTSVATAQPQLLSQINERSVLRVLRTSGPCSRAEVTRQMSVTAPTVSKAVATLLRSGLLEEFDSPENGRGRPAKQLRLATKTAQVIGVVLDARECRLVTAGLDGRLDPTSETRFPTPSTYERLIDAATEQIETLRQRNGMRSLGLGISMPGLIDSHEQTGLLSPNVPITNGRAPAVDLGHRLGLPAVLMQECHALCLAERQYGNATGLDDFAMLDATTGVGLGVFSRGGLLTGSNGLAGEIGHLPVDPNGLECGCGRNGCLETLASDTALARMVSVRLGRQLNIDGIIHDVRQKRLSVGRELNRVTRHLAYALATAINLFNPSTLFVCSRLFDLDTGLFDRLVDQTGRLAMRPSFEQCRIERARGSKREGAVAGIIEHLTDSRIQFDERETRAVI